MFNFLNIFKKLKITIKRFIACSLILYILVLSVARRTIKDNKKNIKILFQTNETRTIANRTETIERIIYNNPNGFDFILNPGYSICGYDDESQNKVELLIYVHTAIDHFTNREIIRESWGNRTLFPTTRLVFMIGFVPNPALLDKLNQEMRIYHDIVQSDFFDTYRNLTYKSMKSIKWASKYCPNVINFIYFFIMFINSINLL